MPHLSVIMPCRGGLHGNSNSDRQFGFQEGSGPVPQDVVVLFRALQGARRTGAGARGRRRSASAAAPRLLPSSLPPRPTTRVAQARGSPTREVHLEPDVAVGRREGAWACESCLRPDDGQTLCRYLVRIAINPLRRNSS